MYWSFKPIAGKKRINEMVKSEDPSGRKLRRENTSGRLFKILVFFLTPIYLQWINNLGKQHKCQGVTTSVPAVVETQGPHTFSVGMST